MAELDPRSDSRILGLTGPIACGKTTVGDLLLELGARDRIDADRVVHTLYGPDSELTKQVCEAFGPYVMAADGSVDRRRLGALVFTNRDALRRLEAIVHPAVRSAIHDTVQRQHGQGGVVVIDAVKLLQSDLLELCDAVWVVQCPPAEQRRRLIEARGMAPDSIQGRLAAQPVFQHGRVTTVIDNSSSREELCEQVVRAWRDLCAAWEIPPAAPAQ